MLCEKCGLNHATTHIRSVVNGVIHEKHLCSHCAANEGEINSDNLIQLLSSMFDDNAPVTSKSQTVRCACCGSSFKDIADSGKCGCSECYNTFYEQLLPYLKRVHGSTGHIGKIPDCVATVEKEEDKIEELRELLKQLVNDEKYEEAAVIRDKIKVMESEIK